MISVKAFAKFNLNLHVFPKNPRDQYSQIKFLNCQLNLFDKINFIPQPNNITLSWAKPCQIPDKDNLILKAAQILKEISGNPQNGVLIEIDKNIPITGGLAGGSSDAATTFLALNQLWRLDLPLKKLNTLAVKLGTDICYPLYGGICQVEGIGDKVKKLNLKFPKFYLIIIYPNTAQKPSTAFMYQNLSRDQIAQHLDYLPRLKSAIKNGNKKAILNNLFNDFAFDAQRLFPEVTQISLDLLSHSAQKTLLLGSGLGVAGFYLNQKTAQSTFTELSQKYKQIYLTKTLSSIHLFI